jgi:hypothetical protein
MRQAFETGILPILGTIYVPKELVEDVWGKDDFNIQALAYRMTAYSL